MLSGFLKAIESIEFDESGAESCESKLPCGRNLVTTVG